MGPTSLAGSASASSTCLTAVAANVATSLAGSASAAGNVPVSPCTEAIVAALGAKKVARKLPTTSAEMLPTCNSDEMGANSNTPAPKRQCQDQSGAGADEAHDEADAVTNEVAATVARPTRGRKPKSAR